MATVTDLYVAWGVEEGRELVYVDADGHSGEFEIISDADLQIDLYQAGYSYAQIRKVIRSVRYSRAQGTCDTTLYVQTPRRCTHREASCAPVEPPAPCRGRALLRTNDWLKFLLAASFCVIAGLVVYGRFN